jgi:hypothetical protein
VNHREYETVACETCGEQTPMTGTKRCDRCWEVERRLKDYLERGSRKALLFVLDAIREHAE